MADKVPLIDPLFADLLYGVLVYFGIGFVISLPISTFFAWVANQPPALNNVFVSGLFGGMVMASFAIFNFFVLSTDVCGNSILSYWLSKRRRKKGDTK